MEARELMLWMAYDRIDPIGNDRLDYLAGMVATATLNVWRDKDAEPVQPADVVPDWGGLRGELQARESRQATREDWERWHQSVKDLEDETRGD